MLYNPFENKKRTILSPQEMIRYDRQIKLSEIGVAGQEKLKNAHVLCVGAGGLGAPCLLYLTAAGVGTLGICDNDVVAESNLPRQVLYQTAHLGMKKVDAAKLQLAAQNPFIQIEIFPARLTKNNVITCIQDFDLIIDCTDNFATKYILHDACFQLEKPLISASILGFQGQCLMFHGNAFPCFRCLFPTPPKPGETGDCEAHGVLGILPGFLGVLQATEALKYLLGLPTTLLGKVLSYHALTLESKIYALNKDPQCVCNSEGILHLEENLMSLENPYIISPAALKILINEKADIQLIDVRTQEKHDAFNIGGHHIPAEELPDRLHELDPQKRTITYCTSGGRSMRALEYLLAVGFTSVQSLDGGMTLWRELIE